MYNGKIFPSKSRIMLVIVGLVLLVVCFILVISKIINENVYALSNLVIIALFVFLLPFLVKRYEQKQGIKQLTPS